MNSRFPEHLRRKTIHSGKTTMVEKLLSRLNLSTVCQSARCPNRNECYGHGTATFLLMGDVCTRRCRFCAVKKGMTAPVDESEPERVAEAAFLLNLKHVVLTSVTRDDLADGGARHFKETIIAIRKRLPDSTIETLIPDLMGNADALQIILSAHPDVLNHNVETVPRLYHEIRPDADYQRSLSILRMSKAMAPEIATKSGLMLGMGETKEEILSVLYDLRLQGCNALTLGQYLAPTTKHYPVKEYISPKTFDDWKGQAEAMGFQYVASAPYVRSSYHAEQIFLKG